MQKAGRELEAIPKSVNEARRLTATGPVGVFLAEQLTEDDLSGLYWQGGGDESGFPGFGPLKKYRGIAETRLVNHHRCINKLFEKVNRRLSDGDYYIVFVQTISERKKQIVAGLPQIIGKVRYTMDFLIHRVLPKLAPTKRLYFAFTKGHNRAISLTESLGRLVYCGFEIQEYRLIDGITCIVTRKVSAPSYNIHPTYGLICTLNRVGKDGEFFKVYKLRTMYPYAEYVQSLIYMRNQLQKGGKFKNDFRITWWGKKFRRLWIDELPMLWNWVRQDMKLVGVRPLSSQYYALYPEDVRELRNRVRPGLIPPFYADLPETLEEIVESEKRYLESYLEKPLRTDLRYFCLAAYNILVKRARSY